ncbi:hypothetical protein [Aquimarina sp. MMG016]|nr:hypothetical protein [Aquimarina sp. MMG016]MBQ4821525.1 hypothetical protein [Aquimarina sp. MMG016]
MLKNILKVDGVQTLNKKAQQKVKGGYLCPDWVCKNLEAFPLMPACDCDV